MAEAAHDHKPGEPPDIRDEAADTPFWLPALGLALLALVAIGAVWHVIKTREEAAEQEQAQQAAEPEAAAPEAAAPEAAAAPAPTPAPAPAH